MMIQIEVPHILTISWRTNTNMNRLDLDGRQAVIYKVLLVYDIKISENTLIIAAEV